MPRTTLLLVALLVTCAPASARGAKRPDARGAPGAESSPTIAYSPANLTFANANLKTLKPKMDAVDGGGRR
jgi:hypothetical protein